MAWSTNPGGGWTQSGSPSSPALWIFDTRMNSTGSLVVQTTDPDTPVGVFCYADPTGANRYEVICSGGTGGNIEIFKYTQGTKGSALDSAAHGLTTGDPYTIELRWVNGKISVYLNGSTTAIVEYDTANDLKANTRMGFSSQEDGAMVGSARIFTLSQTFAALATVAWWVAGGTLWASDSGRGGARNLGAFFDASATVQAVGAEDLQHAIIVDGTHAVDFDAVAMTAQPFTLTAGKMPGQSGLNTPPGATTSRIAIAYNSRVGFLQEQYAIFSALGDRTDLDLTVDNVGKAFVWPSQVGEPLLGAYVAAKNRLIMWGRTSTWELTGDPVLGGDVTRISNRSGGSGPYAACMVENGTIALHSDQGLQIIKSGGNPEPLSERVLTSIIQTDNAADTMWVTVVQDTESFGLWIFLTPADGSLGRFLWYDERTGGYAPENGGFWPQTFGDAGVQATCAMRYMGKVVFGTVDGQMLCFDRAARGTDAGHDFDATLTMAMVKPAEQDLNVAVWDFNLIMGRGSDPTSIEIWGGNTPERAFGSEATLLWSGDMTLDRENFSPGVSAPALAMRLTSTGAAWAFESLQVAYGHEPLIPIPPRPALTGTPVCQPATPATPPDTGDAGSPGPGPGETDPGGGGGTECTLCATWMAAHTTGSVGGHSAVLLATSTLTMTDGLQQARDLAYAALDDIITANICGITDKDAVVMHLVGSQGTIIDATYPETLIYFPIVGETFNAYFRCEDQTIE